MTNFTYMTSLVSEGKNRCVIAESGDKKVWAGVVKKNETDEVQIAIWTESQGVKTKSKKIDKSDIINGGTALGRILDNYDIRFEEKDSNGNMVSSRKEKITEALKKVKELIKTADDLSDPDMGMNLTEIHNYIIEQIDKKQGSDGIYINVQKDSNLVGCDRRKLKEILDEVSDTSDWTIKELCSELNYQGLMQTDRKRLQHAIDANVRGYVFKRCA